MIYLSLTVRVRCNDNCILSRTMRNMHTCKSPQKDFCGGVTAWCTTRDASMEDRPHVARSTLSSLLTSCLAVHCLTNKSNIIGLSSQQSSKDHYTYFRGQQLRTLYAVSRAGRGTDSRVSWHRRASADPGGCLQPGPGGSRR